jgi:hypothetical protein
MDNVTETIDNMKLVFNRNDEVIIDGVKMGIIRRDGAYFTVVMDSPIFKYHRMMTGDSVERSRMFSQLKQARRELLELLEHSHVFDEYGICFECDKRK